MDAEEAVKLLRQLRRAYAEPDCDRIAVLIEYQAATVKKLQGIKRDQEADILRLAASEDRLQAEVERLKKLCDAGNIIRELPPGFNVEAGPADT